MRGQIGHEKSRILKFYEFFFKVVQCLIQSEVKRIILVISSLCEVRFNPREIR